MLVTEGVTEGTQWIIDDASTRLRADGGCRGVGFLVPERSGSGACDLQASTAAYLFGVAARGGEVIAEVRT